jgi:hypothetical protein
MTKSKDQIAVVALQVKTGGKDTAMSWYHTLDAH